MYFNETKIDKNEVIVDAHVSTPLNISRKNTNKFSNHSRTIINFHKYGNIGIIDLDIVITLKNKSGVSYDLVTTIYVVVYGVSGHQNDVPSNVWDGAFIIQNNEVKFEANINMNNKNTLNVLKLFTNVLHARKFISDGVFNMNKKLIQNLGDGIAKSNAINVKQLNEMESNIAKYVKKKSLKQIPV